MQALTFLTIVNFQNVKYDAFLQAHLKLRILLAGTKNESWFDNVHPPPRIQPVVILTDTLIVIFQGWFSPGQLFVLDEYCARYGVRGCCRHLYYLLDLLDKAESGIMIDPTLLHYSYAFCASHVHGNR